MCKQNSMRLKPRVTDVCKAIETVMILSIIRSVDHGHEKKHFYRSIFTEIKEFATISYKLVINFGYRGRTVLV